MFRAIRSARRKTSHLAMAIALASGAVMGTAFYAPAVEAQEVTRGFFEAYQPVAALSQGESPDLEGARGQLETVYAAIENDSDRMAAGNLTLIIGNGLDDAALQRRGLEMMLESGQVAPEQVAQFHFFVGNLAYNMEDYAAARAALNAAMAAGYVDNDNEPQNDPEYIILQSYLVADDTEQGLAYLSELAETRAAAGSRLPENWLLRGLQETYNMELLPQSVDVSEMLISSYPSEQNWTNGLQVIGALYEFDEATAVDLLRLMRETNSISQRQEYVRYIEDLDPRIMGNEVLDILELGMQNGIFDSGDPYYVEVLGIATPRAQGDRNSISRYISEARAGDGLDAMSTADVLYSLDDFTQAEEFYRLAAERGVDANHANLRIGITQVQQGNYAAAIETLGQVTGIRAPVARMWSLYAEGQGAM